jgi:hypothetical protein
MLFADGGSSAHRIPKGSVERAVRPKKVRAPSPNNLKAWNGLVWIVRRTRALIDHASKRPRPQRSLDYLCHDAAADTPEIEVLWRSGPTACGYPMFPFDQCNDVAIVDC